MLIRSATGEVVRCRTIKRLPSADQCNKEMLTGIKGTPLQPAGPTADEDPALILPPDVVTAFHFSTGGAKRKRNDTDAPDDLQPKPVQPTGSTTAPTSTTDVDMDSDLTGDKSTSDQIRDELDRRNGFDNHDTDVPAASSGTAPAESMDLDVVTVNHLISLVGTTRTIKKNNTDQTVLLNEEVQTDWSSYFDENFEELEPQLVKEGILSETESLTNFDTYVTVPFSSATTKVLSTRYIR
jgi:hypothetical protein